MFRIISIGKKALKICRRSFLKKGKQMRAKKKAMLQKKKAIAKKCDVIEKRFKV